MCGVPSPILYKCFTIKPRKTRITSGAYIKTVDVMQIQKILESETVDKIVTDPPWGIFENTGTDINDFYLKFLKLFLFIIKNDGIIVLLTARKEEFRNTVSKFAQFTVIKEYNILVSGKKAAVYKISVNKSIKG